MGETSWTPSMVEERFVEAADVMRRLPSVRVPGHFNTWPKVIHDFADLIGQEPPRLRRPPPSPTAISRMEEALAWLAWLAPTDAKIVWLKANGERWKNICWKVGLARAAANERWLYGLCAIAWRLNGWRLPTSRSKRYLINRTSELR
jgi:hypothetical protein